MARTPLLLVGPMLLLLADAGVGAPPLHDAMASDTVLVPHGPVAQTADPPPPDPLEGRGRFRVGLTLGGTTLAGLTFEARRGGWAAELTLGTVTFRDLSLALTGKRYFSGRTFQPYAGVGLWGLGARSEEGSGAALIARFPAGLDWKFVRQHSIGGELSLNRALWVDRVDPEDQEPPRTRLIPIPSLYYRYGATP